MWRTTADTRKNGSGCGLTVNGRWQMVNSRTIFLFLFMLVVAGSGGSGYRVQASMVANNDIFLPVIARAPIMIDVAVTAVEITQSVQKSDNSVPLVADRQTVVRVFAQTMVGSAPDGVVVSLSGMRGSVPLGTIESTPGIVPVIANRDDFGSSFNFLLPNSWTSGNVTLVAVVDAAETVHELDETNNALTKAVSFNVVPDLQVKIVPINYTHTGATAPGYYPGEAVDHISDWILRAYPVDNVVISFHSAYDFTGDLEGYDSWSQLLNEMHQLKVTENAASSVVYYAYVPTRTSGGQRWFYSGIAGIGYVGWRASVGLDLGANDSTGSLAGHEIGHNLGRYHAPCGGVANPDPNYPYSSGSIGEYGLDVPHVVFFKPGETYDLMSYCGPEWLSDYTYKGLYDDQRAQSLLVMPPVQQSMMLGAVLTVDGLATMQPVYVFDAVPTAPGEGEYAFVLRDAAGNIISAYPAILSEAAEDGVSVRTVHAVVPIDDDMPIAAVQLWQNGRSLATRALQPNTTRTALQLTQTAQIVTLQWGVPDVPALVRYTPDAGQTWITLGLQVMGGEMAVDTTALPGGNGRFVVTFADTFPVTPLTADLDSAIEYSPHLSTADN